MDFSPKKPMHLFALFALVVSLGVTVVLPLISYFMIPMDIQSGYMQSVPESMRFVFQLLFVLFQLLFVFALFVGVPVLWYVLVNRLSLRQFFSRIGLRREKIDEAVAWGFLGAGVSMGLVITAALLFYVLGFDLTDASNVSDLQALFSFPLIFVVVLVQPIAEEIFFRGFLFDKLSAQLGSWEAIIGTAVLFGLAHLSYGKVYPAAMAALLGVVLGYILLRTKNLYAPLTAHVVFNVVNFSIYLIGQEIGIEALII